MDTPALIVGFHGLFIVDFRKTHVNVLVPAVPEHQHLIALSNEVNGELFRDSAQIPKARDLQLQGVARSSKAEPYTEPKCFRLKESEVSINLDSGSLWALLTLPLPDKVTTDKIFEYEQDELFRSTPSSAVHCKGKEQVPLSELLYFTYLNPKCEPRLISRTTGLNIPAIQVAKDSYQLFLSSRSDPNNEPAGFHGQAYNELLSIRGFGMADFRLTGMEKRVATFNTNDTHFPYEIRVDGTGCGQTIIGDLPGGR